MGSCSDVVKNGNFKITTVNALVIEEYIITVYSQILVNKQCPWQIRASVTDENGLFDALDHDLTLVVLIDRRVGLSLSCGEPPSGMIRVWSRLLFCVSVCRGMSVVPCGGLYRSVLVKEFQILR